MESKAVTARPIGLFFGTFVIYFLNHSQSYVAQVIGIFFSANFSKRGNQPYMDRISSPKSIITTFPLKSEKFVTGLSIVKHLCKIMNIRTNLPMVWRIEQVQVNK